MTGVTFPEAEAEMVAGTVAATTAHLSADRGPGI